MPQFNAIPLIFPLFLCSGQGHAPTIDARQPADRSNQVCA
jgi:hypothetical protein